MVLKGVPRASGVSEEFKRDFRGFTKKDSGSLRVFNKGFNGVLDISVALRGSQSASEEFKRFAKNVLGTSSKVNGGLKGV